MTEGNPEGPVNPPPTTEIVPTPPAQPAAPPAPPSQPSHPTGIDQMFSSLQQGIDGLPESFISGMKEAFPVLSQPPAAPADANADTNAGGNAGGDGGAGAEVKEGRQPSRLAQFWFGGKKS